MDLIAQNFQILAYVAHNEHLAGFSSEIVRLKINLDQELILADIGDLTTIQTGHVRVVREDGALRFHLLSFN